MPNVFDAANAPFDRLTSQEVETLRAALDIAYFRPGETIIAQNAPAGALFVYCDGSVHFLQESISYDTYQRLGDRRDGAYDGPQDHGARARRRRDESRSARRR